MKSLLMPREEEEFIKTHHGILVAGHGRARRGEVRRGLAWQGEAWCGKVRSGEAGLGMAGPDCLFIR